MACVRSSNISEAKELVLDRLERYESYFAETHHPEKDNDEDEEDVAMDHYEALVRLLA